MSPKRNKDNKWPPRVTFKNGSFYFLKPVIRNKKTTSQWISLGKTEAEMYKRYGEMKNDGAGIMAAIIQRYRETTLKTKAANTQNSQGKQLDRLTKAFGHMRPSDIRPAHIAQYHDIVGESAPYQANRELALIKHVLKYAVRWGYIDDNPAREIERHSEHPRTRYVTDDELNESLPIAPLWIEILGRLAYTTGQRRADLLSLKRDQLLEQGISITQSKTGKKLILEWTAELRYWIDRALCELPAEGVKSMYVICDERGQRRTDAAFTTAWTRHMNKCIEEEILKEKFQFRDIRAKAGSDSDGKHLGHQSEATLKRHYKRLPEVVKPTN